MEANGIGSPGHSPQPFTAAGRVYLYRSTDGLGLSAWDDYNHLDLGVNFEAFTDLGSSVAFGYFDDTGRANMVAGAPRAEGTAGRVHVIAPWRQPGLLQCRNSVVFDCDDKIVWSQKPFDPVYLASSTKSMTILIAVERTQLPTSHPDYVSPFATYLVPGWVANDIGGSQFGLVPGEIVNLQALMGMTMSVSGNDAAYAIADLLTGSNAVYVDAYNVVPEFIDEMNVRAQQLGMFDTIFTNPPGFSGAVPESTAYDMALLGRAATNNPGFEAVVNNDSWVFKRTVPVGPSILVFDHEVGGGFVAALRGFLGQATGLKDGGTPKAGIAGVFSAREDSYPWGTAVGSSFNTPAQAGWIVPDAADMLKLGLKRCFNGPIVAAALPTPPGQEKGPFSPANLNEYHYSFYPPDPIQKKSYLELHNLVQDGSPTDVCMEVQRESVVSIPDLAVVGYSTKNVSGHDGITMVNEGAAPVSLGVSTNAVGSPFHGLFLLPGGVAQIAAEVLPPGVTTFLMSISHSSSSLGSLRITENYSADYVMGTGATFPTSVAMIFDRPSPNEIRETRLDVTIVGQDTDPGHQVGLVSRGPDAQYTFDPWSAHR